MRNQNGVVLAAALASVIGFSLVGCQKSGSQSMLGFQGQGGGDGGNKSTQLADAVNASPTPEPVSALLFGAGALGYAGVRRLRRRSVDKKKTEG